MAKRRRVRLTTSLDLVLPDGLVLRVRPGPNGKGVSLHALAGSAGPSARDRKGTRGVRGRPPNPSTVELRALLAHDLTRGGLKASRHYIDWLAGREARAPRTRLQQTVYREMRAAGGKGRKKVARQSGQRARAKAGSAPRRKQVTAKWSREPLARP